MDDKPTNQTWSLKTALVAITATFLGLGLMFLAKYAEVVPTFAPGLASLPVSEVGSTLLVTGALAIVWNYFDARDKERRDDERLRRLLKEAAPEFKDAVIRGFGFESDDLKRVASPELLDGVITNALSMRLGDQQFASEIYQELLEQAVRAPERWHDVDVNIRLSPAGNDGAASELLHVLVEWEYTTIPSHPVRRFACVSDRDEFAELTGDTPATFTWFMSPRPGRDPSAPESFELLSFSVDGQQRPIRRSARKGGQTYSASIGEDVVRAGQPVRIKHLYRTTVLRAGDCCTDG